MRLSTEDFTLDLPDGWSAHEDEDGHEYRSPDGAEQLVVIVRRFRKRMPAADLRRAVDQEVALRAKNIHELSRGSGMVVPVQYENEPSKVSTSFSGTDPVNAVLIFGRAVASPSKLVIASYYGPAAANPALFVARAQAACDSVLLPDDR